MHCQDTSRLFAIVVCVLGFNLADDICGIPKITPEFRIDTGTEEIGQIVGGYDAIPHSFPWMVGIYTSGRLRCAGTLIHRKWILTAAHCVRRWHPSRYDAHKIVFGKTDKKMSRDAGYIRGVANVYMHGFNYSSRSNDIALVELTSAVYIGDFVQPVCLPKPDACFPNDLVATGWGYISGTADADVLQQVQLNKVTVEMCNSTLMYPGRIHEGMVCAGSDVDNRGVYYGDSGGPLISSGPATDGVWTTYGITSWGSRGLPVSGEPGVFTEVARHVTWIQHVIAAAVKR